MAKPTPVELVSPTPVPVAVVASASTPEQEKAAAMAGVVASDLASSQSQAAILSTAGQRWINRLWEVTQAIVTVSITIATIIAAFKGIESKTLDAGFFAIISMYLARTNHTKVGGVQTNDYGR
jgi:hypothetical protein